MKRSVKFTIHGQVYSLKNSHIWGRGRSIKNPAASRFERDFLLQVPPEAKLGLGSKKQHLKASVEIFYPSWRQDVDAEIIWDLLQKAGVVQNDRWIRIKHVAGTVIDPINPRVIIELMEV